MCQLHLVPKGSSFSPITHNGNPIFVVRQPLHDSLLDFRRMAGCSSMEVIRSKRLRFLLGSRSRWRRINACGLPTGVACIVALRYCG